jgi:hypothetical protein
MTAASKVEVPSEDVLERIRKLLRLAFHASATEGEAASALEHANALLLKYNLTTDAVARGGQKPVEDVADELIDCGSVHETWRHQLLVSLAAHNLCEAMFCNNTTRMFVIGRKTNVVVTREMFFWIAPQFERLAQDEYARLEYELSSGGRREYQDADGWCENCQGWATDPSKQASTFDGFMRQVSDTGLTSYVDERGHKRCGGCRLQLRKGPTAIDGTPFKEGFMRGIVYRVAQRLALIRRGQEHEIQALVLSSTAAIVAFKSQRYGPIGPYQGERMPYGNGSAFHRGQRRGDDVVLGQGQRLGSSSGAAQPALGRG